MEETVVGNPGGGGGGANNIMRWEKLLPKMVLRVLLIEPDDSTRHIIALLLRKCNYKVAIVSDGLKAWELLNSKPHSIDLILTEVDLPSINGFALLSLIAQHDVCKNMPVIMMSAQDSVSTVYKCMLRGAADFLVKPLRKNELNNLWQHVWRRQSACQPHQKAAEAMAENNATSNRSSEYKACIKHNRESLAKGTDAQSSCTKPDEASSHMAIDINPKNVIDLIGSFDSFPRSSLHGSNKVDHSSSMLDLSLGSHPSSPEDQMKHRLKQSDASAFSLYINRTQQKEYQSGTHSAPVGSCQSQFPSPKQKVFHVPVAIRGVRFENPGATYCSVLPPVFPPIQSQDSSVHQEPSSYQENITFPDARSDSQERHNLNADTENRLGRNMETLEDGGHFSSATYHSASSAFYNNSIGSGSNGHVCLLSDASNDPQLTQREAALKKFRLKRKDRCYDKKVRYESRKKLAEQRPRVKGQFARQVQTSNISSNIECGNQ